MDPRSIPKKSHKDLKGVPKINFTMLQNYIKIIPIKYAVKYITLQHGHNKGLVNHIDKYHSYQPYFSKALRKKNLTNIKKK